MRIAVAVLLAVLVVLAADTGPRRAIAVPASPHIIVIMADDLDVHTLETLLALGFLPNLKAYVVDRGVRFRESFVTNSLCCPSRSTYLTGRYSHNHLVLRNNPPFGSVTFLDDSSTLATWLQAAGYRTGHVGKYLNGYGSIAWMPVTSPLNPAYVPPGWSDWHALVDPSTYDVCKFTINENHTPVPYDSEWPASCRGDQYQTNVLAARARRFIEDSLTNHPGQPMFLTVTPLAPHVELGTIRRPNYPDVWRWWIRWNPDDETNKPLRWNFIFRSLPLLPQWKAAFNEWDVTDKPVRLQRPFMMPWDIDFLTWQYRTRFASMLAVDDLVGTVARALGDELANSVIIFTSDNGFLHGEHRMAEKLVAYEESIRVPLYVAGAGISAPRNVDDVVLNNDLAPTIAQLAGTAPGLAVDGRSLVPILTGPKPADWRRRFLVEHWVAGRLSDNPPPPPATDLDVPNYAALRTGPDDLPFPNRLYVEHFADPTAPGRVTDVELYDLALDPDQLHSLHADPSRAIERAVLHELLTALRRCGAQNEPTCESLER